MNSFQQHAWIADTAERIVKLVLARAAEWEVDEDDSVCMEQLSALAARHACLTLEGNYMQYIAINMAQEVIEAEDIAEVFGGDCDEENDFGGIDDE